jgi:transcriptional regulator of acetoin/glycerol metabolism
VQAKLLRVVETREVTPLGASRSRRVTLRVCSATHRDLRAAVGTGEFREDLYFRIGKPDVQIPPLRERIEEIPWLITRAAATAGILSSESLVEACVLRHWPGNVRELDVEVRRAAADAKDRGRSAVSAQDLAESAGLAFEKAPPAAEAPDRASIEEALRDAGGNVTQAARALGMHRNQLRRWLAKEGVDPRAFGEGA